jgi:hypothetical protein
MSRASFRSSLQALDAGTIKKYERPFTPFNPAHTFLPTLQSHYTPEAVCGESVSKKKAVTFFSRASALDVRWDFVRHLALKKMMQANC